MGEVLDILLIYIQRYSSTRLTREFLWFSLASELSLLEGSSGHQNGLTPHPCIPAEALPGITPCCVFVFISSYVVYDFT